MLVVAQEAQLRSFVCKEVAQSLDCSSIDVSSVLDPCGGLYCSPPLFPGSNTPAIGAGAAECGCRSHNGCHSWCTRLAIRSSGPPYRVHYSHNMFFRAGERHSRVTRTAQQRRHHHKDITTVVCTLSVYCACTVGPSGSAGCSLAVGDCWR